MLRYDEAVDDCTEERAHLRRLWRDTMPIAEPLAVGGRTYLQGHGIPAETAIAARVRFADLWGDKDDYAGPAVVFSLQDSAGKLVAAEGRFMTPPAGVAEPLHVGFAEHGVFEVLPGAFAVVARRAACPAQRLREPRPLPKSRRRQDCGDSPHSGRCWGEASHPAAHGPRLERPPSGRGSQQDARRVGPCHRRRHHAEVLELAADPDAHP